MNAEVYLSGGSVHAADVRGRTAIVVDVLRASTTIAHALHAGARSIVPVPDMARASEMAGNLDHGTSLLGGERDGVQIEGYALGNSPSDYSRDRVQGKTIILLSTNGTGAIVACAEADEVLVGGLVNASAVVSYAKAAARDVVIVCAGWKNRVALEDTLCAGLLLDKLWDGRLPGNVFDAAHIAATQYHHDRDQLAETIGRCNHAKRLKALGLAADIPVCTAIDSIPVVPVLRAGRIVNGAHEVRRDSL
jgi:2-phosphosulfolactate phosphatase